MMCWILFGTNGLKLYQDSLTPDLPWHEIMGVGSGVLGGDHRPKATAGRTALLLDMSDEVGLEVRERRPDWPEA